MAGLDLAFNEHKLKSTPAVKHVMQIKKTNKNYILFKPSFNNVDSLSTKYGCKNISISLAFEKKT